MLARLGSVLYWAGCLLAAPLLILAVPAAAQSIPAVKDADWCRAFDPKTEDPACVNPVSRKPPVPIRPGLYLTPPLEYDHPYSGELITVVVDSQDKVRELCPGAKFNPNIGAIACARRGINSDQGKCWIIIANDELITSLGHIPDRVRDHEIAHCNGWPADHRGALAFKGAVLNAALQFDNFAFNAVRKTVAEVAGDLAKSDGTAAAQFVIAAKGIGLTPESKLTPEVLSDSATAGVLAKAIGLGAYLTDEQWKQAHNIALQTARKRQAEKAAAAGANALSERPGRE
jgi:hypothetical protein